MGYLGDMGFIGYMGYMGITVISKKDIWAIWGYMGLYARAVQHDRGTICGLYWAIWGTIEGRRKVIVTGNSVV